MSNYVLFSEASIKSKLKTLAYYLNQMYSDKQVVLVALMNASYQFLYDVSTRLNCEHQIVTGHSTGTHGFRDIKLSKPLDYFNGKNVLLLDTVCDSGESLSILQKMLVNRVSSIKTCVVVNKKHSRVFDVTINFSLFNLLENYYIYGYGMDDSDGLNRNIKTINVLEGKTYD